MALTKEIFTRVKNDINGNPRYVVHFLECLSDEQRNNFNLSIQEKFNLALNNSRKFGGKKYRGKDFGGGIVFQSYETSYELDAIKSIQKGL